MNNTTFLKNCITVKSKIVTIFVSHLETKKMKTLISTIVAIIMMAGLTVNAQQDKKVVKAKKNVAKAQQDLKDAKIKSSVDYKKFVHDAKMNIAENKKTIAILKLRKAQESKEDNEKYSKKIMVLEKKNNDLEMKIKTTDHTNTNIWERYKLKFDTDMQKLVREIKEI